LIDDLIPQIELLVSSDPPSTSMKPSATMNPAMNPVVRELPAVEETSAKQVLTS
jgi:hypothetical protein